MGNKSLPRLFKISLARDETQYISYFHYCNVVLYLNKMQLSDFICLEYKEKLHVLNQGGKFLRSFNSNEYHHSVYKLPNFYVELRRKTDELNFDSIFVMNHYFCNRK